MAQQYRDHILSLFPKDASGANYRGVPAHRPSEPPIIVGTSRHCTSTPGTANPGAPVVRPARNPSPWVVWDPHVEHPLNSLGIAEPEGEEYDTQALLPPTCG